MDLPHTLHGQLYLLAYDRSMHKLDCNQTFLGFALRAAMLTDLYLTGRFYVRRSNGSSPPNRSRGVD